MKRLTLAERLLACMQRGDLSLADLAHWLDRPYATVRTWVYDDRYPHGVYWRTIDDRLKLLEHEIVTRTHIPVKDVSAHDRPNYLRGIRDAAERVSKKHTA
jgi:cyanate lyase